MTYRVDHVRFTLECDVCGIVEKRDLDNDPADPSNPAGTAGWSEIRTYWKSFFCCPTCVKQVNDFLNHRAIEAEAEKAAKIAACEHDYQPRGFFMRCTKCEKFR